MKAAEYDFSDDTILEAAASLEESLAPVLVNGAPVNCMLFYIGRAAGDLTRENALQILAMAACRTIVVDTAGITVEGVPRTARDLRERIGSDRASIRVRSTVGGYWISRSYQFSLPDLKYRGCLQIQTRGGEKSGCPNCP